MRKRCIVSAFTLGAAASLASTNKARIGQPKDEESGAGNESPRTGCTRSLGGAVRKVRPSAKSAMAVMKENRLAIADLKQSRLELLQQNLQRRLVKAQAMRTASKSNYVCCFGHFQGPRYQQACDLPAGRCTENVTAALIRDDVHGIPPRSQDV